MIRFNFYIVLLSIVIFIPPVQAIKLDADLPDSLGKWYKPENKRQVWLHTMFGMRRELQAVDEYVEQKNVSGIEKWSKRLISHYHKLSEMVPEWEHLLDLEVINAFEKSVQNLDFNSILFNSTKLQENCLSCHNKYRVLASLHFRSADFSSLTVNYEHKEYLYRKFMKLISRTLNRIRIATEDEYWSVAANASNQLQLELKLLGTNCAICHKGDEPFDRIFGLSTKQSIDKMETGIVERNSKMVKLGLGETAVKVCARCHAIHRTISDIRRLLIDRESNDLKTE